MSYEVLTGSGSAFGDSNLVLVSYEAVQEPSRAMLLMLGMLGLLQRRKRHASAVDSAAL